MTEDDCALKKTVGSALLGPRALVKQPYRIAGITGLFPRSPPALTRPHTPFLKLFIKVDTGCSHLSVTPKWKYLCRTCLFSLYKKSWLSQHGKVFIVINVVTSAVSMGLISNLVSFSISGSGPFLVPEATCWKENLGGKYQGALISTYFTSCQHHVRKNICFWFLDMSAARIEHSENKSSTYIHLQSPKTEVLWRKIRRWCNTLKCLLPVFFSECGLKRGGARSVCRSVYAFANNSEILVHLKDVIL